MHDTPVVVRALVYPPKGTAADHVPTPRRAASRRLVERTQAAAEQQGLPVDDYRSKLVKYIPAEVIAFYTPLAAFIGNDNTKIAVVTVAGAVGAVAVIYGSSFQVPADQRARWYTYLFGLLAYAAWALGISTGFRHLVHLSDDWAGIILAIAALLLPAFDIALSHGRGRNKTT